MESRSPFFFVAQINFLHPETSIISARTRLAKAPTGRPSTPTACDVQVGTTIFFPSKKTGETRWIEVVAGFFAKQNWVVLSDEQMSKR